MIIDIRCRFVNSNSDLFKTLKWLPFPKYVELNPHYMNKPVSYTQENHSYGTRSATSSLLALPKCNKSIGQKSFHTQGPEFGMAELKQSDVHHLYLPSNLDTWKQCTVLICSPGALRLLVNMPEGLRKDPYHWT